MPLRWKDYAVNGGFDELIASPGRPRPVARQLTRYLSRLGAQRLAAVQQDAELSIKTMGITFTVYSQDEGSIDRAWPLDIIPRIIARSEWERIERGLMQRVQALNLFVDDLYHEQRIIKDGRFPREVLRQSVNFRKQCVGMDPPLGVWAHICGTDLVRDGTGRCLRAGGQPACAVGRVLHAREPAGHQARNAGSVRRLRRAAGRRVSGAALRHAGGAVPAPGRVPEVVVLTPGIYNSAYFEHAYLAQQMGCELVEGRDSGGR